MTKIEEGAELSQTMVEKVDRSAFIRYAGASGDFNPIHQDEEFARAAGMGGVFGHGMLTMGFVAQ